MLDVACEDSAVESRVMLLNLVTALLIVGGVLLLISWSGPSMDPGMTVLGLVLAAMHFAAAAGTALRRRWGRLLGLVVGWIGLFGTGAVLVTFVASIAAAGIPALPGGGSWLGVLLIPAAMVAAYAVIVVVLMRNRAAFEGQPFGQLG